MNIELRDPNIIMKLSRLGSFHQSKLSFLRSFLREFKDWDYNRDLFDLDENGFGIAVYSFKKKERVYSLICFANKIDDNERSDRVIATKWDAAFTLHDGIPLKNPTAPSSAALAGAFRAPGRGTCSGNFP